MTSERKTFQLTDDCRIESGTNFYIEIEGSGAPVTGTFVGITKNRDVVVTPPLRIDMIMEQLAQGNSVVIKYIHNNAVFVFHTVFLKTLTEPARLLVFKRPESVKRVERRSEKRVQCFIPVKTELFGKERDGTIRDMSKSGCRCNFYIPKNEEIPLKRIERVVLSCQFPGIKENVTLTGEVKNYFIDTPMLTLGILFRDVTDELRKIIDGYIFSIQDFS